MRKFAVIGLGQYGLEVATTLGQMGAEVIAIDASAEIVEAAKHHEGVLPICMDATDERALRATGLDEMEAVVVAIGQHLEVSIVVTALLAEIPVSRIIARASTSMHQKILERVGAHVVHNPEVEMAQRDAQTIFAPYVRDRRELPTGHHMVELDVRDEDVGKPLGDLAFRSRHSLIPIAIKKRNKGIDSSGHARYDFDVNHLPEDTDVIDRGDILVLIGERDRVNEFQKLVR
ncbi:MAG: trk system potassium uptake protein TrkA [Myxococcota bacterium]